MKCCENKPNAWMHPTRPLLPKSSWAAEGVHHITSMRTNQPLDFCLPKPSDF